MKGNLDPQFFKVIAVMQPKHMSDLIVVIITLQNMKGEKQEKKIVFTDMFSAWEFYRTQQKMLGGR